jgi:hypothetical protein
MFAAIRRASSRVNNFAADLRPGSFLSFATFAVIRRASSRYAAVEHESKDAVNALAAIVGAVAAGELTPGEAAELSKVVDGCPHIADRRT